MSPFLDIPAWEHERTIPYGEAKHRRSADAKGCPEWKRRQRGMMRVTLSTCIAVQYSDVLMVNVMPVVCRTADARRLASRRFARFACLAGALTVLSMIGAAFGQSSDPEAALQRCRTIADDAARLRCFEEATARPIGPPSSATPEAGPKPGPKLGLEPSSGIRTWRLVRTPNPISGPDAVSIMRTADIVKSDIDLAGLMLRCSKGNFEVIVVLVRPLPPRAHPKVTVGTGGGSVDFTATVLPPGVEVLLPADASALASGPWQTAPELSVQIASVDGNEPAAPVKGIIPLAGLGSAIPLLLSNCPSQQ
jgi:hypothetical protein